MPPVTAAPTSAAPAANPQASSATPTPEGAAPPAEGAGQESKDPANLAKRFEVLSRREARLAQDRNSTKAEREAFQKEKETLMKDVEEARGVLGMKESFKKSPAELLKWAGISFDDLVKAQLDAERNPRDPEAQARLEKLEKEIEEERQARQKDREEREAREKEEKSKREQEAGLAVVDSWMGEVSGLLEKHPEKYEFSSSLKDMSLIMDVAEKFAEETGQLASAEEILEHVEQQYYEEATELLKKCWGSPKLQKILEELRVSSRTSVKETTTDVRETKTPSPTLRNGPASAPVVTTIKGTTSRAEKLNRAASRLQFSSN